MANQFKKYAPNFVFFIIDLIFIYDISKENNKL